ncbi:hypothetical protein QUW41_07965 [Slackia piriformis]|nr:hypothetical protein [Slackia piriformis]
MGFKIKYTYPNGEEEIDDDVYATEQEAEWAAEDGVTGFATGAEILEDRGEDFTEGSLEYEIIEE